MTTEELKLQALALAVTSPATDKVAEAIRYYEFLQGAPAQPSSNSDSSTTAPAAPRKKRSSAPAASTSPESAATAAASSTSTEAKPAEAAAPSTTGTSPASSTPSKDDVRGALTRYQAACGGGMAPPREILTKYAPSGTLGTLKDEDYSKLIAELDKATAAKKA